jgi:hypothetical protein
LVDPVAESRSLGHGSNPINADVAIRFDQLLSVSKKFLIGASGGGK